MDLQRRRSEVVRMKRFALVVCRGALAAAVLATFVPRGPCEGEFRAGEPSATDGRPRSLQALEAARSVEQLRVRAFLVDTGEPAAGAVIHRDRLSRPNNFLDSRVDLALLSETPSYQADLNGELRLERPLEPIVLFGETESGWGMVLVRPEDDGPVLLRLERAPSLRVRVLDLAGRPVAGVPLALFVGVELFRVVSREPDGRAEFHPSQAHLAKSAFMFVPLEDDRLLGGVRLAIATPSPVEVKVPLDRPAPVELELRLPPTGELAVALVDGVGEPLQVEGTARLRALEEDAPTTAVELEGHRATFPFVSVGARWELTVSTVEYEAARLEVQGPRLAGEREVVTVQLSELAAPRTHLTGVLVDARGEVLGGARLQARLADEGSVPLRTDAAGRFRLRVREPNSIDPRSLEISTTRDGAPGELGGRWPLAASLGPAANDLGRLELRPAPLLVAGRVLDASGVPVAGALVRLQIDSSAHVREIPMRFPGVTERDGSFRLHGFVAESELLRLQVKHLAHEELAPFPVTRGESEREVLLQNGASVEGRLLLEEDVAVEELEIRLAGGTPGQTGPIVMVQGDGRFRFPRVEPGTYSLRVTLPEDGLVARVPGIEVAPGQARRDARLDPLDLRSAVRAFRVSIVDERGEPVQDATLSYRASGRDVFKAVRPIEGCRRVLVRGAALDVEVSAPGRREAKHQDVAEDLVVVLPAGD